MPRRGGLTTSFVDITVVEVLHGFDDAHPTETVSRT
jgi:hypothetical protein